MLDAKGLTASSVAARLRAAAEGLPLLPTGLLPRFAGGATVILVGVGVLLAWRRLAGAFSHELSPTKTLLTATVVAALLACSRVQLTLFASSRVSRELAWTGSAGLWLIAAACTLPALRLGSLAVWAPLIVLDHLWRQKLLREPSADPPRRETADPRIEIPTTAAVEAPSLAQPDSLPLDVLDADPEADDGPTDDAVLLQELFRRRDAEGVESVHGRLWAEFVAGQRHATLHAGFCPPLDGPPEVEAELADGPEGTVRVVQALTHGVRLEVRLAEPAEEACEAAVELSAWPRSAARRG
jgi:hypothetical protein